MTRVLVFINHYLPARNAGGVIRSAVSMVNSLTDAEFYIYTSDTDLKSSNVLAGIQSGRWQQRGREKVFYSSGRDQTMMKIRGLVHQINPDLIYLHSYFARRFTQPVLMLRRLGLLGDIPIILAPQGEFSRGALQLKSWKKRLYILIEQRLGLYQNLVWHAFSRQEAIDIRTMRRTTPMVVEAPNFPPTPIPGALKMHHEKTGDQARLVFLSRISPIKNLLAAIEILSQVRAKIVFDVFGPIENQSYWTRCQKASRSLPENITMTYHGDVEQGEAERIFRNYDALFLPTRGENYGYVIPEAWAAGTPVIISDLTPWTEVESEQAGWVSPLSCRSKFIKCIEVLAGMDESEHSIWREGAYRLSESLSRDESLKCAYHRLFSAAQGRYMNA